MEKDDVTETSQRKNKMAVDWSYTVFTTEGSSINMSPQTYDHVQLAMMARQIFPAGMN